MFRKHFISITLKSAYCVVIERIQTLLILRRKSDSNNIFSYTMQQRHCLIPNKRAAKQITNYCDNQTQ